jgi:uncharacterized membrane protein
MSAKSVDQLTRRNVETIAAMEHASQCERTRGERIADGFAAFVGSWAFVIGMTALMGAWIVLNSVAWIRHWDEYPFVLLNLALSFQAAYAMPILMMSQNRQAKLSERRNHLDLQINLLAEQESTETLRMLRRICERLDIRIDDQPEIDALEQRTHPDQVVKLIDRSVAATQEVRDAEGGGKSVTQDPPRSVDVETKKPARAQLAGRVRVNADHIVVATNTPSPINDWFGIYTKQASYRTYVIAATVPRGSVPDALYWDTGDPYHYVRLQRMRGGKNDLLLIGGEDHKTGQFAEGAVLESRNMGTSKVSQNGTGAISMVRPSPGTSAWRSSAER